MKQAVDLARALESLLADAGIARSDQRYQNGFRAFDVAVSRLAEFIPDTEGAAAADRHRVAAETAAERADDARSVAVASAEQAAIDVSEVQRLHAAAVLEADRASQAVAQLSPESN